MDIMRGILDGIAIAAIFNGIVATLVLINPRLSPRPYFYEKGKADFVCYPFCFCVENAAIAV